MSLPNNDTQNEWIPWFLMQPRGKYFVHIDENYLSKIFNYYGIRQKVNMFSAALELIIKSYVQPKHADMSLKSQAIVIEQQAETLYGLLHSRYIITDEGMKKMKEKYMNKEFPTCPRKLCQNVTCLPYGISNELNEYSVKLFCPCCREIYNIQDPEMNKVDGAFFGPSWVHPFMAKYPELFKDLNKNIYTPTIYGFKISTIQYHDEEEDTTT